MNSEENPKRLILRVRASVFHGFVARNMVQYYDPLTGKKILKESIELFPKIASGYFKDGWISDFDNLKDLSPEQNKIVKEYDFLCEDVESVIYHPFNGKIYVLHSLGKFKRQLDEYCVSCFGTNIREKFEVEEEEEICYAPISERECLMHFGKRSRKFLFFQATCAVRMFEIADYGLFEISKSIKLPTTGEELPPNENDYEMCVRKVSFGGIMSEKSVGELLVVMFEDDSFIRVYNFLQNPRHKDEYEAKILKQHNLEYSKPFSISVGGNREYGFCLDSAGTIWKFNDRQIEEVESLNETIRSKNKEKLSSKDTLICHLYDDVVFCYTGMVQHQRPGIYNQKSRTPLYMNFLVDCSKKKHQRILSKMECGKIFGIQFVNQKTMLIRRNKLKRIRDEMSQVEIPFNTVFTSIDTMKESDGLDTRNREGFDDYERVKALHTVVPDFRFSYKDITERIKMMSDTENPFLVFRKINLRKKTLYCHVSLILNS